MPIVSFYIDSLAFFEKNKLFVPFEKAQDKLRFSKDGISEGWRDTNVRSPLNQPKGFLQGERKTVMI